MRTIFTNFGQNTAQNFNYDNHILTNNINCIFWQEFGLK